MPRNPPRIALMPDLEAGLQRHTGMFAGMLAYGRERAWQIVLDEFADDTLSMGTSGDRPPFDGVIARATVKLAERAERLSLPVVNVWLNSPVAQRLPGVFPDYEAVGVLRAEHLLACGYPRFAVLVSRSAAQVRETTAFRGTVESAGRSCIVKRVPLTPTKNVSQWRSTERTLTALMEEWTTPVGVFVAGEAVARHLVQMCRTRGLRVPEDVAIVAGYNELAFCERLRPSLTSVDIGAERVGYEAARLLDRLLTRDSLPSRHVLLPPRGLVVRESTDFVAVEDEVVAEALAFIAANAHRRISREDVARAVHAETRTLQNRFRKAIDRPVAAEIRRVRLERAKRELAHTTRRLSDIAREAGFGKLVRMCDVFRREVGVTPGEYRRQRQVRI